MKAPMPRQGALHPATFEGAADTGAALSQGSRALPWVLGAAVAPYFVLRGWLNAAVVVLGLAAVLGLFLDRRTLAVRAAPAVLLLACALCAPLPLIVLAQLLHGEFVPRRFDGPARLALSAALLLWLHLRRVDWLEVAGLALPVAVLGCAAVVFAPAAAQFYWDGRLASYFMDPLMLSQHVAIVAFMCLFLLALPEQQKPAWKALKLLAFATGVLIALRTGSRTGWLVMPVAALLWITRSPARRQPRALALGAAGVVAACVIAYLASTIIQERVGDAVEDVRLYFSGERTDTSLGIRFSLFRIAWEAFSLKPLIGWGYGQLPPPQALPGVEHLWTPAVHGYYVSAGVHNEWLQNMVYGGVLGLVSRLLLLGVPLVLFGRAAWHHRGHARLAGYLGLVLVTGYAAASMSSEVFNMVYLSAFYGLLVAACGAAAWAPSPSR